MLSIFIIYSNDRRQQLDITVSCLQEMEGYQDCQKILCVDGPTDIKLLDFKVISVPRTGKLFNWSSMWNAGITAATFDNILYLDSDRILPINYLTKLFKMLADDKFIYSKDLVRLNWIYKIELTKKIRDNPYQYHQYWTPDIRLLHPPHSSVLSLGKNPMSGNTAFTKRTWFKSGGLDTSFEGWGFPDTEYYLRCLNMGMKFEIINCVELHLYHTYGIATSTLQIMNLWNAVKVANKFNMELDGKLQKRMQDFNLSLEIINRFPTLDKFLLFISKGIKLI